jgi:ferredoxin-NADP reductase
MNSMVELPELRMTERLTQRDFWRALPERWDADVEDELVCCQIRQETHDVKSFFFASPSGRGFVFEPGQFVTLELDIDGETINRCYTISSPPTRPHTISITVKRVPGGPVSNWLHDRLIVGARVRVLGPAGEFTSVRHPAPKYLFLSAGSGVTPLISMSRTVHELGEDRDIVFVHSARTPDDIIFARELDLIAANQSRFRTAFVCERVGARTNWSGLTGFLSLPMLKLIAPDFMEREIFTCGPAPYMAAVRAMLDEAGFDRARYHEESFSFGVAHEADDDAGPVVQAVVDAANTNARASGTAAATSTNGEVDADPRQAVSVTASGAPMSIPNGFDGVGTNGAASDDAAAKAGTTQSGNGIARALPDTQTAQRYAVRFARSNRQIDCGVAQTVLDAARQAGVRLPSSCSQGMCGTCKVKLVDGKVDMAHKGGIRQREIDSGMVLLCCSKPLSDLVVDK